MGVYFYYFHFYFYGRIVRVHLVCDSRAVRYYLRYYCLYLGFYLNDVFFYCRYLYVYSHYFWYFGYYEDVGGVYAIYFYYYFFGRYVRFYLICGLDFCYICNYLWDFRLGVSFFLDEVRIIVRVL